MSNRGSILTVDVSNAFATSKVPTLYLRGLGDRLVPGRVADRLLQLRPDLERVDVHAPHLVLQSKPEQSAAIIADFVRKMG
jgi:pimeloyl-ACP methyl ester carboxylesterase